MTDFDKPCLILLIIENLKRLNLANQFISSTSSHSDPNHCIAVVISLFAAYEPHLLMQLFILKVIEKNELLKPIKFRSHLRLQF